MGGESPVVELYDSNGNPLSVQDGVAIPASTPGLLFMGSDGTNSRYVAINSSGQQIVVGAGTAGTPTGGVITIQGSASGTAVPVSGTVTANAGSGNFAVVQATAANLNATVVGTVTANIGTTGGLALDSTLAKLTITQGTALGSNTQALIGGSVTTVSPTYTNGQISPISLTTAGAIRIDGSGVTQPVSGTVTTNQGTSPWVTNITQFGGSNVVTGTGASGAGIPRVTVSNDSNILATQSGTWTVQQGTPPWTQNLTQVGGSSVTTLAAGEQKVATEGLAANGAAASGNPVLIGGKDDANVARTIRTDPAGDVRVVSGSVPSNATYGNPFGQALSTNPSGRLFALRATAYTEQTTNAQRSVKSSSTNDTNTAGTGARQIVITYLDQTGAGPFTETVNLNGTTAVNTVSTTICFIEEIHVISVGSTGSNQGTISLFTTTGGGGSVFATIGVNTIVTNNGTTGDNQTIWAHHYTPTGKTSTLVATAFGTNGNQTGNGMIRSQNPTIATSPEIQITGTIVLDASSPTITRAYQIPVPVVGPARTTFYGISAGTNTTFYGVFEYWDI